MTDKLDTVAGFSRRRFLFGLVAAVAVPVVAKAVNLPLVQRAIDAIPEPVKALGPDMMTSIWADLKEIYNKPVRDIIYDHQPLFTIGPVKAKGVTRV